MPSPDTIAAIILAAVALLLAAAVAYTEPGGLPRLLIRHLGGEHPGRRVRPAGTPRPAHGKPLVRHAAPRGFADDPRPLSALETVPDPVVSPFAARAAL